MGVTWKIVIKIDLSLNLHWYMQISLTVGHYFQITEGCREREEGPHAAPIWHAWPKQSHCAFACVRALQGGGGVCLSVARQGEGDITGPHHDILWVIVHLFAGFGIFSFPRFLQWSQITSLVSTGNGQKLRVLVFFTFFFQLFMAWPETKLE